MNIVCRGDSHLKKWLKIDDGVIFLRYICRKGCIINQKGLKFGRKKQYLLGILCMFAVTSFAEVWIEIDIYFHDAAVYGSLPSRKCGLKSLNPARHHPSFLSLPSRKCGLKSSTSQIDGEIWMSLPSRKCGLKSDGTYTKRPPIPVTSFAEVWIEIIDSNYLAYKCAVTSFAEVWIEIGKEVIPSEEYTSLPSRKCGLKLLESG